VICRTGTWSVTHLRPCPRVLAFARGKDVLILIFFFPRFHFIFVRVATLAVRWMSLSFVQRLQPQVGATLCMFVCQFTITWHAAQ
jgi:hypothetical protein